MKTCRICAVVWAIFSTLIPVIVLMVLLKVTVIPNYHGAQFQVGTCLIENSSNFDVQQFVWKDCSCGVLCTAKFPCIPLAGHFTPFGGGNASKREGLFYTDYSALQKDCFMEPDKCEKDSFNNSKTINSFILHTFHLHWHQRMSFHCWGYERIFYLENNYSIKKAIVALVAPIFFIIAVPLVVCILWCIFKC